MFVTLFNIIENIPNCHHAQCKVYYYKVFFCGYWRFLRLYAPVVVRPKFRLNPVASDVSEQSVETGGISGLAISETLSGAVSSAGGAGGSVCPADVRHASISLFASCCWDSGNALPRRLSNHLRSNAAEPSPLCRRIDLSLVQGEWRLTTAA